MRILTTISVLLLSLTLATGMAVAKSSIVGSWVGGGKAYPKKGAAERVRCRVTVYRAGKGYQASSNCKSAIGSATPSAYLTRRGNVYSGRFKDRQNNATGWIRFRLNGRRMSVSLGGAKGSASLSLRKR